jgi:hypothetical protein
MHSSETTSCGSPITLFKTVAELAPEGRMSKDARSSCSDSLGASTRM